MTKIAIIPAPGIGDGLIMHIFSHRLAQMGHEVTTFNDHLAGFRKWLPGSHFSPLGSAEDALEQFDIVVLQHDNSPRSQNISKRSPFRFFGSHNPLKHSILQKKDYVCDPNQTMVENVARAMEKWFGVSSKENGLRPPEGLAYRKYKNRIAIHSGSGAIEKNWPRAKFERVARWLKEHGYNPVFLADDREQLLLPTLEDLASFIYESGYFLGNDSGPGHLASYLQIPSLVIGKEEKQMRLWRPGWFPSKVITPPLWSSYWKWTREKWKLFINETTIIKEFSKLNTIKRNI